MFVRHVSRDLSAYLHDQLSAARRGRIEKHLATCRACATELEEIRLGSRFAEALPGATAPGTLWPAIESTLDRPLAPASAVSPADSGPWRRVSRRGAGRVSWRWAVAVAAALVLCAGGVTWYVGPLQRLRLVEADPEPSPMEVVAIGEHDRRVREGPAWDLQTEDLPRIRDWVQARSGLSASMPDERPAEDAGRFRFAGAGLARVGVATAAVVGFEVDSRPVTLVTARLQDLAEPPHEGRFSKNVAFRSDPDRGYKVLTWGSDGQAYVMVSALPEYGQQGCFVCHTTPERRALIRGVRLRAR